VTKGNQTGEEVGEGIVTNFDEMNNELDKIPQLDLIDEIKKEMRQDVASFLNTVELHDQSQSFEELRTVSETPKIKRAKVSAIIDSPSAITRCRKRRLRFRAKSATTPGFRTAKDWRAGDFPTCD
jgi:hypothetical protein